MDNKIITNDLKGKSANFSKSVRSGNFPNLNQKEMNFNYIEDKEDKENYENYENYIESDFENHIENHIEPYGIEIPQKKKSHKVFRKIYFDEDMEENDAFNHLEEEHENFGNKTNNINGNKGNKYREVLKDITNNFAEQKNSNLNMNGQNGNLNFNKVRVFLNFFKFFKFFGFFFLIFSLIIFNLI